MEPEKAMQPFSYQGDQVRTVIIDGVPWFVASDVCKILGIGKHRDAVARLDEDERGSVVVDTPGGKQSVSCISESGLYHLIFQSRKEQAQHFRKWVTGEVLPAIRKTGSYSMKKQEAPAINSLWHERLTAFNRENTIPDGYWSVFGFVAGHCFMDTFRDVTLSASALPDASIGRLWCEHLRESGYDMSLIRTYPHKYPDRRGTQPANIYPNAWLGAFWDWFHTVYLREHYPRYVAAHQLQRSDSPRNLPPARRGRVERQNVTKRNVTKLSPLKPNRRRAGRQTRG